MRQFKFWSLGGACLTVVIAATLLSSCSDDECTLNCNGDMRFPLVVGSSWQYEWIQQKVNFRPDNDTITQRPLDSLLTFAITMTITNVDTIEGNVIAFEFHEVVSDGDSLVSEAYSWYANFADGLYSYPDLGSGPGVGMLTLKPVVGGSDASPTALRSYKILEYPLREGIQWEFTNGYGDLGAIFKTVIGIGEQTVPAGKFDCYAVAWLWERISNLTRTSYYSDVGLVRHSTVSKDIEATGYDYFSGGIGKYDLVQEIRLTRSPF